MVSNVDNSENVKLPLYKSTVESTYGFLGDEGKKNMRKGMATATALLKN